MLKTPHFVNKTAHFVVLWAFFTNDKSATLYPAKGEVADLVLLKECNRSGNVDYDKNTKSFIAGSVIYYFTHEYLDSGGGVSHSPS